MNKQHYQFTPKSVFDLLLHKSYFTQIITSYLDSSDLISLLLISKQSSQLIKTNPFISNKIAYQQLFKIQKHSFYSFAQIIDYQKIYAHTLNFILSDSTLNINYLITNFNHLKTHLIHNLQNFVSKKNANKIFSSLMNSLINPDIALPKLRRQNAGVYCSSSLQLHIVDSSLGNMNQEQQLSQEQCLNFLKFSILQKQKIILDEIDQKILKKKLLKIRFQSQQIQVYEQSESSFVNIMTIILVIFQEYLKGLKKIFMAFCQIQQNFGLFIQFNTRYNQYRNTIINFTQKFKFLFIHFEAVFNLKLPKYQNNTMFQPWKILIKKWIKNMNQYHQINNKCNTYLFLISRQQNFQNTVDKLIQNYTQSDCQTKLFTKSNELNYLKIPKFSQLHKSSNFNHYDSSLQFIQNIRQYSQLYNDYTQYLIDTSIHQITVHWCGSTQHILGNIYSQYESQILRVNSQRQKYLQSNFKNSILLDYFFKQQCDFLQQKLKPTTCFKIIKQFCKKFQNNQNHYNFSQRQKQILENFVRQDQLLRFINEYKPMQIQSEYLKFYQLDKTISLEQIERLVIKNQKANDFFEMDNEEQIEGYLSEEESDGNMQQREENIVKYMIDDSQEQVFSIKKIRTYG